MGSQREIDVDATRNVSKRDSTGYQMVAWDEDGESKDKAKVPGLSAPKVTRHRLEMELIQMR